MADTNPPVQPGYNAAGQGRRLRMFRAPLTGPNSVNQYGLSTIVGRSRAFQRNEPWAGAASDKWVANVVGTGIQAKAKNGSKPMRAAHKKVYDRWMKVCDADGVLDGYGQQALAARECNEVGEVFGRLRKRRLSDGLPVPLQVQIIEAEQCPADYYGFASNGNPIRAGIEFNPIGQRVAYWMYPQHPGDPQAAQAIDAWILRRVPAEEIMHVFEPLRAGQIRGIPRSASTTTLLYNIGRLNDNELERQDISRLFAGFFTTAPGSEDTSVLGPLAAAGTDAMPLVGLEPGLMQELPPGMGVEFSTPPDPGANYLPFMKSQLLAFAARHGVPYEVLTGDLAGISDRALKLILNEFRRLLEQQQWLVLIPLWCQRIREAFFDAGVLSGAIDAPGYADDPEEYTDTIWVPQGWPYSHPVQDVDADVKAARAGFKSRASVVLANGDDPEEVTQQIIDDNKVADDNDLIFDSDARYTSTKGVTQAKPAGSVEPTTDDTAKPNP